MFVCVCRAVTETEVRKLLTVGSRTLDAVTAACGAGADCGSCRSRLEAMIEDGTEPDDKPLSTVTGGSRAA